MAKKRVDAAPEGQESTSTGQPAKVEEAVTRTDQLPADSAPEQPAKVVQPDKSPDEMTEPEAKMYAQGVKDGQANAQAKIGKLEAVIEQDGAAISDLTLIIEDLKKKAGQGPLPDVPPAGHYPDKGVYVVKAVEFEKLATALLTAQTQFITANGFLTWVRDAFGLKDHEEARKFASEARGRHLGR